MLEALIGLLVAGTLTLVGVYGVATAAAWLPDLPPPAR
jgi:hypothetical protein